MSESIKRNYIDPDETMWVDGDTIHVDAPKVCKILGIPPTPENQDMVTREAFKVAAELLPSVKCECINDLL